MTTSSAASSTSVATQTVDLPDIPPPPRAPEKPRSREDDIVFVGMNPDWQVEAHALQAHAHVIPIHDEPHGVTVHTPSGHAMKLDLGNDSNLPTFAASLGLPGEHGRQVADVLRQAEPNARNELGQIAQVWARGEKGHGVPGRLALSGHSIGAGIFGEATGTISYEDLARLGQAMPRAAAQVEDIALNGCNTFSPETVETLRSGFPNLRTVFGYEGSAPGASSGAVLHEAIWEHQTRGRKMEIDPRRAEGSRMGAHVASWSQLDGIRRNQLSRPLRSVEQDFERGAPVRAGLEDGSIAVADPQHGPGRDAYNTAQELRRPPEAARSRYASQLPPLIEHLGKLLFYSKSIAPKFAHHYVHDLRAGYHALGRPVPNFAHLSRRGALAEMRRVHREAMHSPSPAVHRLDELLEHGLRHLENRFVPPEWI